MVSMLNWKTRNLTTLIENQEMNLNNYDADRVKAEAARIKMEKEENFLEELRNVKELIVDCKLKRCIELACEKGASAWLTALPLQKMGYLLNKQEFRDAICLRYGWRIPNTPSFCRCKVKNTHDHTRTPCLSISFIFFYFFVFTFPSAYK